MHHYNPWITLDKVRNVLLKFKAKKSTGPDKFKLILFKFLPKNITELISIIYRTCLALHYTPRQWKESIVVIPKKDLEKLLVEQMDIALEEHPIHINQQGFQRAKSTETAI